MSNTSLTHLDGEEFVESTRLIRRWLNYETVPADAVAAELRKWADHCAPAPTDSLGEIAWQFNEAVSLLREAREHVAPDLLAEIDEALPAIQSALERAAASEETTS